MSGASVSNSFQVAITMSSFEGLIFAVSSLMSREEHVEENSK